MSRLSGSSAVPSREPAGLVGRSPALIGAGAFTSAYVLVMLVLGLSCSNLFLRLDNQIAVGVSLLAGAALLWVGAMPAASRTQRVLARFPAGLVAGLYFQPSTAIVLAASVTVLVLADLLNVKAKLAALLLFILGGLAGYALMLQLMSLVSGSSLRC